MARILLVAAAGFAVPALAVEPAKNGQRCLTPSEQSARAAAHVVVPLAKAMRAAKVKRRELVRASLCESDGRLIYRLTVLRGGRVVATTVDAGNGVVIAGP